MGQKINLEPTTVSNYLGTLVRIGLLARRVPATVRYPERSRKSRYVVTDPFLRFYHRFLAPQLSFIMRGATQSVWSSIERHWRAFVGTHTFEELCQEWVYAAAEQGELDFLPQRVGSHWSSHEQIDVVAIHWDEAIVLYGECKWKQNRPLGEADVRKLIARAGQVDLKSQRGNPFTTRYAFFCSGRF